MPLTSVSADPETIAARAAALSAQIDALTAEKKALLEQLLILHDMGHAASRMELPDGWTLQWSAGRQTYNYPSDVIELEASLQSAKEAAVATKRATPKPPNPFWTVRKPSARKGG